MKIHAWLGVICVAILYTYGPRVSIPRGGVHPKIKPYFEEFNKYGKKYKKDWKTPKINIGLANLEGLNVFYPDGMILGACNYVTRDIVINKRFMEKNLDRIEEVIFHELGHCVLRRGHIGGKINGKVISIMNPYILEPEDYDENRDYYIKELFLGEKMRRKAKKYLTKEKF